MRVGFAGSLGAPSLVCVAVVASAAASPAFEARAEGTSRGAALQVGQPAPNFLLPVMQSTVGPAATRSVKRFRLADHVGPAVHSGRSGEAARGVLLSFAASYCEPCRGELRALRDRADALAAAGVKVAVVVIDTEPAGIETMRRLTLEELRLPFPILSDRFGVLARRYGATTLPLSVVVDGGGTVRAMQSGFRPGTVERLVVAARRWAAASVTPEVPSP